MWSRGEGGGKETGDGKDGEKGGEGGRVREGRVFAYMSSWTALTRHLWMNITF